MDQSGFYTGKGDRGTTTRLGESQRVGKDSALIEVIGTLDETTAAIGVARADAESRVNRSNLEYKRLAK